MYKTYKVRLKPTVEQIAQMKINADCARYAYNWTVGQFKQWQKGDPRQSKYDLAKALRTLYNEKDGDKAFLKNGCSQAIKQAVYDADTALQGFFKGRGFPKFKSRHRTAPKYFVPSEKIKVDTMRVWCPKTGWIVTSEQLPRNVHFTNPRVSFDGKYWYIAVGELVPNTKQPGADDAPIGVDLGVTKLATVSDGRVFENPAKSKTTKQAYKKLKRAQRKRAKKHKKGRSSSQNYKKTVQKERLAHRRMANIRKNACHQLTAALVKTKPSAIVIEDLNVTGMLKNHKLAHAIASACFAEIRRQLEYKCERNGIKIIVADRWHPSSKKCSGCGSIKARMSLGERTYQCEHCGISINRDLNAAVNLAQLAS